jgi:hypothetical protein
LGQVLELTVFAVKGRAGDLPYLASVSTWNARPLAHARSYGRVPAITQFKLLQCPKSNFSSSTLFQLYGRLGEASLPALPRHSI